MQARRRAGLRSFPARRPAEWACQASNRRPPCAAGCSRVRDPSGASLARSSARRTPGASDSRLLRSHQSGGSRRPCPGLGSPEHPPAATSQRSLQACIASWPSQSSLMSRLTSSRTTSLGVDHGTIEGVFGLRGPLQSGDLKLIGQMAPHREPEYPSVPAVSETNPGISAIGFMTLAAPAGVPESIQRRLADGLRQALDSPAVKKSYADLGVPIRNYTPEQTKAFVENEQKIWWPLVREFTPPEARN